MIFFYTNSSEKTLKERFLFAKSESYTYFQTNTVAELVHLCDWTSWEQVPIPQPITVAKEEGRLRRHQHFLISGIDYELCFWS